LTEQLFPQSLCLQPEIIVLPLKRHKNEMKPVETGGMEGSFTFRVSKTENDHRFARIELRFERQARAKRGPAAVDVRRERNIGES